MWGPSSGLDSDHGGYVDQIRGLGNPPNHPSPEVLWKLLKDAAWAFYVKASVGFFTVATLMMDNPIIL